MQTGELGQPPEGGAAGLRVVRERGHRHQTAQERVALAITLDLALGNAALRLLAGEVDLEQPGHRQPAGCRIGVDSMMAFSVPITEASSRYIRLPTRPLVRKS